MPPDKAGAPSAPVTGEQEAQRPPASFVMPSDEEIMKAPEDSLSKTVPKETMKELDSFIRMLKDYTIIEMVRTGVTGLMRADYEEYRENV